MSKQACKRIRRALSLPINRDPLPAFAWPGGYPIFYVFLDGGVICPDCLNANVEEIDGAMREGNRRHSSGCGGWAVDGMDVNYEDEDLICDHCGEAIPAAYAD